MLYFMGAGISAACVLFLLRFACLPIAKNYCPLIAAKCEKVRCEFYSICEDDGKGGAKCVCPSGCVQVEYSSHLIVCLY